MLLLPQVWECFRGIAPADVAIGLTGPPVYSSRRPASPGSTPSALAADKVHYCEKIPDPADDSEIAGVHEQLMVGKSGGAAQSSLSPKRELQFKALLWLQLAPPCVVWKNGRPTCLRKKVVSRNK